VGETAPRPQPLWEYCEIEEHLLQQAPLFGSSRIRFVAAASGPNGRYIAGASEELRETGLNTASLEQGVPVVDALIKTLTGERWELLAQVGRYWYSYTFRRRVTG
jgi:hypothetical protein